MSNDAILVELEAISKSDQGLFKLRQAVEEILEQVRGEIEREKQRLSAVATRRQEYLNSCEKEVSNCEQGLANCLSCVDEDGYPLSCIAERMALNQAKENLAKAEHMLQIVMNQIARFDDQSTDYSSKANQFQNNTHTTIEKAHAYLGSCREQAKKYFAKFTHQTSLL